MNSISSPTKVVWATVLTFALVITGLITGLSPTSTHSKHHTPLLTQSQTEPLPETIGIPLPSKKISGTYHTKGKLHLRTGVGTKYKSLLVMPKHANVKVSQTKSGWFKITYKGKTGWASGKYLKKGAAPKAGTAKKTPAKKAAAKKSTTKKISGTYHTKGKLHLRTGAGTKYKSLLVMPKHANVKVSQTKSGWIKLTYKGKTGWASAAHLKKGAAPKKKPAAKKQSPFVTQVKSVMAKHCPASTKYKLNDPRLGSKSNGVADWYNNTILLRSSMPSSRVGYVTAHECAHIRQYNTYKGNVAALQKDMNRIYGGSGFSGLEQNADCMTRAWGYSAYNYTKSCGGARGKAAQAIIKGKKP